MAKKIDELLKQLAETVSEKSDKKVIKTIKMKPEWIKMHAELDELVERKKAIESEFKQKRNLMWGTISTETGFYENHMTINDDVTSIDVFELDK